MARLKPELLAALFAEQDLTPLADYEFAGQPLLCRCNICGKEVSPRVSTLQRGHRGCKWCAARDRAQQRKIPDAIAIETMRKAGVEPQEAYRGTAYAWKSTCLTCGETVTPRLLNVQQGHKACKFCSGKAITLERAISEYLTSGAKPTGEFPGTNEPWVGECLSCGDEVNPRLSDLQRGQGPCNKCGIAKTALRNKLSEREAVERMMRAGAEPLEPWSEKTNADEPWLCRCLNCERIITPSLHSVSNGRGPCLPCGWKKTATKLRLEPELSIGQIQEAGFEPLEDYPGAAEPWLCKCNECGSVKPRRLASIKSGFGCDACSRSVRTAARGIEARSEMLSRGFEPLEEYVSASSPWLCRCISCGGDSYKRLYSLRYFRVKGCIHCSVRELGSIVYVVRNLELRAYKVGVGKERRINDHTSRGWELIGSWELGTPLAAYRLESEVLNYVREIWQLPQWLGKTEMPQNGHTETFSSEERELDEILHLIARLIPTL